MVRNLLLIFVLVCSVAAAQEIDMEAVQAFEDFRWGLRAFHSGNFEDAVLSLEKSLSRKPQDLRTRYWLGNALYRAGFEDAALAEWRYVLDEDPGNTALASAVEIISYRRGLGEQLEEPSPLVVADVIDGTDSNTYPLRRPSSVRIREDGSAYIVAFGSDEVVLMNVNNDVQSVLRGGLRGFDRPYDCLEAKDPRTGEGFLFIAEYGGNQVLKTNERGDRILTIGAKGRKPGELLGPQYLAADANGYLYVSDWGNARVNKYDFDGNFILSIGRNPRSVLKEPTGIAYRKGQLFVADRGSKRIAVYDDSGNALYSFGDGVLTAPEGIAFYDAGHLLVVDSNRVLEYDLRREIWSTLNDMRSSAGRLTQLAKSPNGEIYIVDFDGNKVYILSEMTSLYTSLFVQVDRVDSIGFPDLQVEVSVEDRQGHPVVGLGERNFIFSESFRDMPSPRLLRSPGDPVPLELSLVVEKSPAMRQYSSDLSAAVESLHRQLDGLSRPGKWRVLSAGRQAVVEAELGATRLESVRATQSGPWETGWRLDRGLRLAAAPLIPSTARRAVILLASGELNGESFSEYSLAQVTDYLQNNSIPLYVVYFGSQPARELQYICSETGGSVSSYYAPRGVESLLSLIAERAGSRYLLELSSRSDPGFGKNFIDLQAEVVFHRKSGRTQSGFFAPLSE